MQSASPSGGHFELTAVPAMAWQRTRAGIPAGALWSSLIVFLLVLTIARSTVAASWVPGLLDSLPMVALAGAVTMGVLALTPLPWWLSVLAGLLAGPAVAGLIAAPIFRADNVIDPTATGANLINAWLTKVSDGSAFGDRAFVLFLITWLMWVTGAWLSWCVLRWRQPMIGLVPGTAALATNVLNFPGDQNGYTLSFIVLTFALLLWSNYTGSIAKAVRVNMKLMGDARWDFWETGVVAMAGLLLLAIMLPPLSNQDRTLTIQSSLFSSWAQLQEQLNHPSSAGQGTGTAGGTTGFSLSVGLGGPLKTSKNPVFTYTVVGTFPGPKYFRGANITETENGYWTYPTFPVDWQATIAKGQSPVYGEDYSPMALALFRINMVSPPRGSGDVLFYPGQFFSVDRATVASEVHASPDTVTSSSLYTVDKLSVFNPSRSNGAYSITVGYPDVSEDELRAAGSDYPAWILPYMTVRTTGYRPNDTLTRIHDLAVSLVKNTTNQYDAANAIQAYLRGDLFRYTLTPRLPDRGQDPLDFFLFNSHEGYCQYYATAMGDMLRSLGIPVRLVNGYGPGSYSTTSGLYTVHDSDAHTWVEAYFPKYGWIPFEPTNDHEQTWNPIQRKTQTVPLCLRDNLCVPGGTPSASGSPRVGGAPGFQEPNGPSGDGTTGFTLKSLDAGTVTRIAGGLLALILIVFGVVARYLRPRTVMGVWKRTLMLARLAGTRLQPGETPLELSRRLSSVFPEAASAVRDVARGFVVAAYAPPDLAPSARTSVLEAWVALRPLMLRRVARRLRPHRA